MDKPRTLPPLVRGKVTSVLKFFVHEITLFRDILLLSDNFDLVLQMQWWGEHLPVLIRPKKLHVQDGCNKNSHSLKSHNHCAEYEVRTTLDLFKSYLKSCERVELCVLEAVKNYIIGSAFLTGIISFLNNNNKPITLPIYGYLGEKIGEVTLHITFLEKSQQNSEQNQYTNSINDKDNFFKKQFNEKDSEVSRRIKSNFFTLAEKTLIYNAKVKDSLEKNELPIKLEPPKDGHDFITNKDIISTNISQSPGNNNNTLLSCQQINMSHKPLVTEKESPCRCFPEITILNDSSKVLHFGSQEPTVKNSSESNKTKVINKFSSNSIKYKSKSRNMERLSTFSKIKRPETLKNSPTSVKNKKDLDFKQPPVSKIIEPEMLPCHKQIDLQRIPSKESSNFKVLNYLLGSDMSKDDEKIALDDFKKMSPSQNLVDSISQLCLVSDKNKQLLENKNYAEMPISLKSNHLNFDLNNPIERNYYEKFFLKSNSSVDFEVAEFLNQPGNTVISDKSNFNEILSYKSGTCTNTFSDLSRSDIEIREENVKENYSVNRINEKKANNCARCKYFKKLDELDTIIESLKHFEEKIRMHEKDLQLDFKVNPDVLFKRNQREKELKMQ